MSNDHIYWMQQAFELACEAEIKGEVPVGAILVFENEIIGKGYNQPISTNDPTAHAEIICLRQASSHLNNYRLVNASMYVTLEPCLMCAGALIHARIQNLIFATKDKRAGAICSAFNLIEQPWLNHKVAWAEGYLEQECSALLKDFFKRKRTSG